MKNNFEFIISLLAGGVGLMFGHNAEVVRIVYYLLIAMGFDLITGVTKATYNKDLKSHSWIVGFMKKVMMLICVSFCYFLDKSNIFNVGMSLESASALFFLTGEVISILENFIDLGVPLPPTLKNLLAKTQDLQGTTEQNMLVVDRTKLPVGYESPVLSAMKGVEGVNDGK